MTKENIEDLIMCIYGKNLSKKEFESLNKKLYEKYKDLEIRKIEDYLKIDEIKILQKKSKREYDKISKLTLDDYINLNILTKNQAMVIKKEFLDKKYFLITGVTASGKSHFSKKLLNLLKSKEYCIIGSQDNYYLTKRKIEVLSYAKNWTGRLVLDELNYTNFKVFNELYNRHEGSLIIINGESAENALKMIEFYNEKHQSPVYEKYFDYSTIYKQYLAREIDYIIVMKQISNGVKVESVKKLCGFENRKYLLEDIV